MQLKEVFDYFDQQTSGSINPAEIRQMLQHGNMFFASKELLYDLISKFDNAENGDLNFKDFIQIFTVDHSEAWRNKRELMKIFKQFANGKKYISLEDLQKVRQEYNDNFEDKLLKQIIIKGSNGGDKLTFDQFFKLVNHKKFNQGI